MKKILLQIKELFFPEVIPEVSSDLDRTNLRNIKTIAAVTFIFEFFGLVLTVVLAGLSDIKVYASIFYCIGICIIVFAFAHVSIKKQLNNHGLITVTSVVISIVIIIWGMMVSYGHYIEGEQILTFYTVNIALMCFVILKPYIMTLILTGSFVGYYIILYNYNKCDSLNEFNYFTMMIVFITGAVVIYHNVLHRAIEKQEIKMLMEKITDDYTKQELELSNTRIKLMQSAMKPHFIFNMLGMIKSLIWEDKDQAARSINDFSTYLRSNIDAIESNEMIMFSRELDHVKAFVALEKTEDSKLNVEYDISVDNFMLPPLTVEPLVENAIIHGIGKNKKGSKITIKTSVECDNIVVSVIDNGVGFDVENVEERVGIKNVRTRLKYSCNGKLNIQSDDKGTIATIIIPKSKGEI